MVICSERECLGNEEGLSEHRLYERHLLQTEVESSYFKRDVTWILKMRDRDFGYSQVEYTRLSITFFVSIFAISDFT